MYYFTIHYSLLANINHGVTVTAIDNPIVQVSTQESKWVNSRQSVWSIGQGALAHHTNVTDRCVTLERTPFANGCQMAARFHVGHCVGQHVRCHVGYYTGCHVGYHVGCQVEYHMSGIMPSTMSGTMTGVGVVANMRDFEVSL